MCKVIAKEIKSMVEEIYGKNVRVLGAVIPHSVRAAETSAEGVSIFKHDPRSRRKKKSVKRTKTKRNDRKSIGAENLRISPCRKVMTVRSIICLQILNIRAEI